MIVAQCWNSDTVYPICASITMAARLLSSDPEVHFWNLPTPERSPLQCLMSNGLICISTRRTRSYGSGWIDWNIHWQMLLDGLIRMYRLADWHSRRLDDGRKLLLGADGCRIGIVAIVVSFVYR